MNEYKDASLDLKSWRNLEMIERSIESRPISQSK